MTPSGSGLLPPERWRAGRAVLPSARRLGVSLLLAALLGVITGPSGSASEPLAGITGSLGGGRAAILAAIGAVGWLVWEFAHRPRTWPLPAALPRLPAPGAGWAGRRPWLTKAVAPAALALALVAPLLVPIAAQQAMVNDIGMYALLALGLNVVVGNAGLLDLGYIAFFAIGAYTTAYLTSAIAMPWHAPFQLNPFFVLPVALVVAALAGVALGAPTLRLRGDYLAIVTLGFGEIVQLLANNADGVTNGSRGVFGLPPLSIDLPGVLRYSFGIDPLPYYYLLLGLIVLVMAVFGVWERSATGRSWAAVRDDEVAARACGVATVRVKLLAFAIGASVSGFAGVVLASKQFFSPQSFGVMASFLVLTVVIFGGTGSRHGVVLGSVVLMGLSYLLRDLVPPADRYLYFGAIVVMMMIFRPQGLLPARASRAAPPRTSLSAPGEPSTVVMTVTGDR